MNRLSVSSVATVLVVALIVGACAPAAAPASPTQAPAAPTKAAAAPAPTAAQAAPVPTAAPPAPTAVPAKKVEYPAGARPITFVVPSAPGGTIDTTARMLAPVFEKDLGVPVQIVNKGGAGTLLGSYDVAQAKPDGYTIGELSLSSLTQGYIDPERQVPIKGRQDFQPIGITSIDAPIVAVLSTSPYKTAKDLVDAAKANPGKIPVSTSGLLSPPHLLMTALEKAAGVQFAFVHFDGAGPAQTALMGGHVDVLSAIIGGSTAQQVRAGTIRLLGIASAQRSRYYPDLKTLQEQGYDARYETAFMVGTTAGTPKEIVDILTNELKKALESDTVKKMAEAQTMSLQYMNPEQTEAFWAKFEPQVKELVELAKKPR